MSYLPRRIVSTYTKIDKAELFAMMGLKSDADLKALGLSVEGSGKFVSLCGVEAEKQFVLDDRRVK